VRALKIKARTARPTNLINSVLYINISIAGIIQLKCISIAKTANLMTKS